MSAWRNVIVTVAPGASIAGPPTGRSRTSGPAIGATSTPSPGIGRSIADIALTWIHQPRSENGSAPPLRSVSVATVCRLSTVCAVQRSAIGGVCPGRVTGGDGRGGVPGGGAAAISPAVSASSDTSRPMRGIPRISRPGRVIARNPVDRSPTGGVRSAAERASACCPTAPQNA